MKNSVKLLSGLLLSALYCVAISVGAQSLFSSQHPGTKTSHKEHYLSSAVSNLLYHTTQTEYVFSTSSTVPAPGSDEVLNKHVAALQTAEQLFEADFFQYTHLIRNVLIRYRKSDMLFPFHYFW